MKFGLKVAFGVSAIAAGQKSTIVNAAPQLVVNSTTGKFTLTSTASKGMNIAPGENVMFLNNIAQIEQAIQERNEKIVEYAEQNGIDINSREGEDSLLKEFTQWFVAKGVPEYDKKGNPVMASERLTKSDKERIIKENGLQIVEENREALVKQFGEMSDEELVEKLTPEIVESPKYHASKGSRTASSNNATGVGCPLGFTDTAIWNTLKDDLEDKNSKNRIFSVLLDNAMNTVISDGYKDVDVVIYPIEFEKDETPIIRAKKDEATDAESAE